MQTHLSRTPLLALALLLGATAAEAAPLRDAATGLVVNPPAGYVASAMPPTERQLARFAIKRPTETETGCQTAYSAAPQNARLSQAEINALALTPGWQNVAKATLNSTIYEVLSAERFDHDGLTGLMMTADFKNDPRLPPRSQQLRSFFAILETPRGRTTTVCVGEKADFATRQAEFLNVARGATAPR